MCWCECRGAVDWYHICCVGVMYFVSGFGSWSLGSMVPWSGVPKKTVHHGSRGTPDMGLGIHSLVCI